MKKNIIFAGIALCINFYQIDSGYFGLASQRPSNISSSNLNRSNFTKSQTSEIDSFLSAEQPKNSGYNLNTQSVRNLKKQVEYNQNKENLFERTKPASSTSQQAPLYKAPIPKELTPLQAEAKGNKVKSALNNLTFPTSSKTVNPSSKLTTEQTLKSLPESPTSIQPTIINTNASDLPANKSFTIKKTTAELNSSANSIHFTKTDRTGLFGRKLKDKNVTINTKTLQEQIAGKTQKQAEKIIDQEILRSTGGNNWISESIINKKLLLENPDYIKMRNELVKDLDNPQTYAQKASRFFKRWTNWSLTPKAKQEAITKINSTNTQKIKESLVDTSNRERLHITSPQGQKESIAQPDGSAIFQVNHINKSIETVFNSNGQGVINKNTIHPDSYVGLTPEGNYIIAGKRTNTTSLQNPAAKNEIIYEINPITGASKPVKNINLNLESTAKNNQIIDINSKTGETTTTTYNSKGVPTQKTVRQLDGSVKTFIADANGNILQNPISEIRINQDGSMNIVSNTIKYSWGTPSINTQNPKIRTVDSIGLFIDGQ